MIRRYSLKRSDNYPVTGRKSWTCSGNGLITIITGFPVTSVQISWSSIPFYDPNVEYSSSSSSHTSSGNWESLSSISSNSLSTFSSASETSSSTSSSSLDSSSSSSLTSLSESSSSSESDISTASSFEYSSSSSSFDSSSTSSMATPTSESSSSSSSIDSSSSSSSTSTSSSSLSSNAWKGPFNAPRIYVHQLLDNGFVVRYENIPEEMGYVEFSYYVQ